MLIEPKITPAKNRKLNCKLRNWVTVLIDSKTKNFSDSFKATQSRKVQPRTVVVKFLKIKLKSILKLLTELQFYFK